ncbi:S8 family serine peptidase [Acidobacteriota bacterium]
MATGTQENGKKLQRGAVFLLFVLLLLLWIKPIHPQTYGPLSQTQFQAIYSEGKEIFYSTIAINSENVPLNSDEKEFIEKSRDKKHGLYEHLMKFYYFPAFQFVHPDLTFTSQYLKISQDMAEEFLDSLITFQGIYEKNALNSLLISAGFFSRQSYPIFRKFLRPQASRIRGQWALEDLQIRKAHSVTKGRGITLAIIDSGVDPSIIEIRSKIKNHQDFLDGTKPIQNAGKFPYDWGGHGTSIASVVSQIAPDVKLLIVKFYDPLTMGKVPPSRWTAYLMAAAIIWSVQNGADIINLSAAFKSDMAPVREAIHYSWENNVIVTTPLGNTLDRVADQNFYYPAAYPWTIAVGGVERLKNTLQVWKFSGKGDYIDVVAPAKKILVDTPNYLDKKPFPRERYGNSLAVSMVAGTAALILSAMDDITRMELKKSPGKLCDFVKDVIQISASNIKLGYKTRNPESGYGMLDALSAVNTARRMTALQRDHK